MSLASASIAVSLLGCLGTLGIMAHEARGTIGGVVLLIGLLHTLPYLVCCLFARAMSTDQRASAWVLAGSLATALVGVGLPAAAFFGPSIDAQAGLIFLVLPFLEGFACAPFLWAAVHSMKVHRNDALS
jgi:hypothetical protein